MKIGIIGSMNMDKVAMVDHIPLKGETLLASNYMETFGGKGANQAVALARLGADVTIFACVGNDGDGGQILKNLEEENVVVEAVEVIDNMPTGCAFINVGGGDNAIVVVQGANKCVTVNYVQNNGYLLEKMDILLLQNEIPTETIEYILDQYGELDNKCLIYNPAPYKKIKNTSLYKASYITPNEHEVVALQKDAPNINKEALIVTRGEGGADYYKNGNSHNVKASQCQPVDTTGAGDTFNGAFAYGLSKAMPVSEAIKFANTAAGISTEKEGAQTGMPTLSEVMQRLP